MRPDRIYQRPFQIWRTRKRKVRGIARILREFWDPGSVSIVSNLPERRFCWGRIILVAAGARKPLDQSFDILLAYGGKSVQFRSLNGCQNVDGTNRYKLLWMRSTWPTGTQVIFSEITWTCYESTGFPVIAQVDFF